MPQTAEPSRREWLAAAAGLLGLTLVFHASALGGHFLVDDWLNIRWLQSPRQALDLFWGNWMFGERERVSVATDVFLYRPIPRLSFLFDRWLWGLDHPAGFHATNLLLHALNGFFLWGIAWTLTRRRALAWGAAAIFIVHPLCVEPAHWISARTDLWAAVFAFPAIWLTLAHASTERFRGPRFWSLPLVALCLMCKESGVVLAAVLLLIDLLWQRGWTRWRVLWWGLTLLLWAWYFVQRKLMFDAVLGPTDTENAEFLFLLVNVGAYLRYLVFPFGAADSVAMHAIAFHLLAFFAIGIGLAVHRGSQTPRVVAFLSLWIICFMIPPIATGNDPWLDGVTVNTRLHYSVTAAGCLLIAMSVQGLGLGRPVIARLSIGLVAILMISSSMLGMRDWWRASRGATQIVQIILDDLQRVPPQGPVLIEIPPEKVGRSFMFRTVELGMAITMIAEEQGIDLPLTAAPAMLDVSEDDPWRVRPLGSDEPYQTIDTVIYFRLTSRLNEPGRVIYRTVRDGETWSLGEVFPRRQD